MSAFGCECSESDRRARPEEGAHLISSLRLEIA